MEFLDPKAKKRHRQRLVIGYTLMATLISIVTLILVFQAYGFDVNRKTGEVIQNGLIYVDSAPDEAEVVFNNQIQKNKTNNRFPLPSGNYDLKLQKKSYRDWTRSFELSGGEVERFTYPLMIPNNLETSEVLSLDAAPSYASVSPDRRWMVTTTGASYTNFTEFDLNSVNNDRPVPVSRQFSIPANILSRATSSQSYELVEWSTDNKNMLIKHTFDGSYEFIVVSRESPASSININKTLGINPDKVLLKDKKADQWYIYTQQGGVLQSADSKKVITPLFTNVTTFKTHGDDTVLYAQTTPNGTGQRISLKQGNDSYLIRDVEGGGAIMLDIARFDGAWYVVAGVGSDQKTYVYKDPQSVLNKKDGTKLSPITVLRSVGPITALSFSSNTRFISTQSSQHFEIYDAEADQIYRYNIEDQFTENTKVTWMDGHRLIAHTGDKIVIFDFDGSNKQQLVSALSSQPVMFDRDYTVLYNFSSSKVAGKISLNSTSLRLEEDR